MPLLGGNSRGLPRVRRTPLGVPNFQRVPTPQGKLQAQFVADLFAAPITAVTSSTTISGNTSVTVAPGDTVFISAGARGGTTTAQSGTISGLPGDAVVEKSPDISASGSPVVQMWRIYLPSGMASGTTLTITWVESANRKAFDGTIWTNVLNANGVWQTLSTGGTANLTAGTTAATTTTNGVHNAAWWYHSATGTFTTLPGPDNEGDMTERTDQVVGASSFGYLFAEDRPINVEHPGGVTAKATIDNAAASGVGVQGIWAGGVNAVIITGAAALTGAGSITADGVHTGIGAAALTGTGSITAAGTRTVPNGAAALSGAGSITAAGSRTRLGAAALAGAGSITAAGTRTVPNGAAALAGAGSIVVQGQNALTATFDGGTAGATISTGDTGALTAWDVVSLGAGQNPIVYDNSGQGVGKNSAKFDSTLATTPLYLAWTTKITLLNGTHYGGMVYQFPSTPTQSARLISGFDSTTFEWCIRIATNGKLQIVDSAFATTLASTTVLTPGQKYRITYKVIQSATVGRIIVNIYANPYTSTILETLDTGAVMNNGAQITSIRYGYSGTLGGVQNAAWYGDQITGARMDTYPDPVPQALLSGAGSITAAGTRTVPNGAAALSGAGSITAAGNVFKAGAAALTGTGTISASGTHIGIGAAALAGAGSITAAGTRTIPNGAAALAGTGTLSAFGQNALTATFDSGTAGNTISTGDAGARAAWDVVNIGIGQNPIQYDNTGKGVGANSAKLDSTVTTTALYLAWTTKIGLLATGITHYGGLIYNFSATPTQSTRLVSGFDSTTNNWMIRIATNGKLQLVDSAGTTQKSSTTILTPGQKYRITWKVVQSASVGQIVCNIYADPYTSTILETLDTTAIISTGSQITALRFGYSGVLGAATNAILYLDQITGARLDTYPAPVPQALLSGAGSITAAGTRTRLGAAALAGAGSITAAGTRTRLGAAALSGAGSITAAGTRTRFGAAALAGTGSITAAGTRTRLGRIELHDTGTIWLGVSDQALGGVVIEDAEKLIGREFVGLRQNADIPANWASTSAHSNKFTNNGYVRSYRALQIKTSNGWADVAAGVYDSELTAFASSITALPTKFNPNNPFIVCFGHETTIDFPTAGTAQEFIDAFRYVRDFFDALGATVYDKNGNYLGGPLQMAYVGWDRMFTNVDVRGGSFNAPPAGESYTDFDPDLGSSPVSWGTSYYEYCGTDLYNPINSSGVLRYGTDAANLMDDVVAQAVARGKDFIIGEFGCEDAGTTTDHTNKASWLASFEAYMVALGETGPGICRGIWTTIKASAENYNVDSSSQALAAYSTFATDSYFRRNLGNGALSATGTSLTGVIGSAALSGAGSITAAGNHTGIGASALAGTGTLSATGSRTRLGAAALSGTGTLSATGTRTRTGACAISGTGTLVASGQRTRLGASTIACTGTLSASGTFTAVGASTITGTGVLSASGRRTRFGASALSGAGSISVSGQRTRLGAAALLGTGALSISGIRERLGAAAVLGHGVLTAQVNEDVTGAVVVYANGSLIAAGVTYRPRDYLDAAKVISAGRMRSSDYLIRPVVYTDRGIVKGVGRATSHDMYIRRFEHT